MNDWAASTSIHTLLIPSLGAISDTITIPVIQGKNVIGGGRNAGLKMLAAGNGMAGPETARLSRGITPSGVIPEVIVKPLMHGSSPPRLRRLYMNFKNSG